MSQLIEITCGEGYETYQVLLTAGSLRTFYTASQDKRLKGKQGESLVSAFRAATMCNGANKIDNFEGLKSIERIRNFRHNDGPNGEPALQVFWANGAPESEAHYNYGKCNDTPEGEPAVRIFNINGDLAVEGRYRDNKKNDGPNGEPAELHFQDGKLVSGAHYQDGILMSELTDEEIRAYNRPSREQMEQNMTAAFPSLRVL